MGKVSPVAAKYIIVVHIEIEGSVDKPDVIGAVFGQTEGLLGTELELRELQRSGKIGRIEVDLETKNGKCSGTIAIPSNMDQAETAIIAAALETIERIGPCNSKVKVLKLEDVRITKRKFLVDRAKELLNEFQNEVMPDSQEITAEVAQSVRMQEISTWGPEKLPAGPGVHDVEEVTLVEGRADVLNLLKNGIKNTVALNGTSIPESIKDLCHQKTVTVFVDGDRGGDLIIRELMLVAEVDFVAKAPDGKEVEELTKKEIHLALRAKINAEQYKAEGFSAPRPRRSVPERQEEERQQRRPPLDRRNGRDERVQRREPERQERPRAPQQQVGAYKDMLDDMVGTRGACLLDPENKILGKVPVTELEATLRDVEGVSTVILDGEITQDLVRTAERARIKTLVGTTSSARSQRVRIVTQREM
jgi:DNA primase